MAEQIEINLAFRDTGLDSLQKDVAVLKKEMAGLYGESKNANGGISAIGKSGISSGAGFAALSASVLAAGKAIYEFAQAADQVKSVEKAFNRVFNGDTFTAQNKLSDLIRLSNELGIEAASLTDTYITLTSRGIKPTNDEIIKLLDLAKAQGKDIGQLTEAILDAQTGEFERLKEFGIKASKDGDSVKLSFRGITKEVNNSEEAIKNAIVGFGSLSGVQGTATSSADNMAAAQARLSNSMKLIASGIGDYFLPVVKDVIEGLGDFASGVSDIVNPIDASNREFREQRELVSRLDQDLPSLVKRYEELTSKGKLNKTEQAELNQTISDISAIVPQAVNSLGDYGSALTVNLERIKSYTAEQKSLLLFTAQSGLVLAR
ncbi:MAG: hypothetical protein U5L45_00465, partial [Saprospiraceae bacterium]|nr:hypothetical protein [Saprospiraceae bacterium]